MSMGLCVKDQCSHYPEQKTLASEGSKFAEHKFVVGSDKEAGTGAEKHNDHEVVNINDAKVNFNKNLILLTASIQIRKKKCVIMFTENK